MCDFSLSKRKTDILRLLMAENAFEVGLSEMIDADFLALRDAGLIHVARVTGGSYLAQITPMGRTALS